MPAMSEKKILVMDDEQDMQIFLGNVLKGRGFFPIIAEDRINGYRKALNERPAVIIINMMIPGEEGVRMYRKLKRDDTLRNIPVIMLSTIDKSTFLKCHNFHGFMHGQIDTLADKFMQTPVEAEKLLSIVSLLAKQGHI